MGREWHTELALLDMAVERTGIDRYAVRSDRAPSDDQRRRLQHRRGEIDAALGQRDAKALREAISSLIAVFRPTAAQSRDAVREIVEGYAAALGDLPVWAVRKACMDFARGHADSNPAHPPTSAELHRLASLVVKDFRDEWARLNRVLRASPDPGLIPPSPEEAARRKAFVKRQLERMPDPDPERKTPLERTLAHEVGKGPYSVGDGLRRNLGFEVGDREGDADVM